LSPSGMSPSWLLRAARRAPSTTTNQDTYTRICDNFLITGPMSNGCTPLCRRSWNSGDSAVARPRCPAISWGLSRSAERGSERRIVSDACPLQLPIFPLGGAALTERAEEGEDHRGSRPRRIVLAESADPVRLCPGPVEAWGGSNDGRHCPAPLAKVAAAVAMTLVSAERREDGSASPDLLSERLQLSFRRASFFPQWQCAKPWGEASPRQRPRP